MGHLDHPTGVGGAVDSTRLRQRLRDQRDGNDVVGREHALQQCNVGLRLNQHPHAGSTYESIRRLDASLNRWLRRGVLQHRNHAVSKIVGRATQPETSAIEEREGIKNYRRMIGRQPTVEAVQGRLPDLRYPNRRISGATSGEPSVHPPARGFALPPP